MTYPAPTTGLGSITGVQITGTGVIVGSGAFEFELTLPFGSTAMVTATPLTTSMTPQSATVTAFSYNGAPTETGESSVNTAFPQPNGGGQQYANVTNKYNDGIDVVGVYPTTNVASIPETAPFVIAANNTGTALIEFTAQGRTGRLNVKIQQPVVS